MKKYRTIGAFPLNDNEKKDMSSSFKKSSKYPSRWILLGKLEYRFRAFFRKLRITKMITELLGPQYKRSRECIEIDITYLCNLHCLNCNRSASQAPEALHLPLENVQEFVDQSISRKHRWRRIRVLGGEPTLHPQFHEIISVLIAYQNWNPECLIEVVTNGYGPKVQAALKKIPKNIWVENSRKSGIVQEDFGPFNLAPCDDPAFRGTDYRNGCAILEDCGMGLTPMGYYPCAIAGGIDRIAGWNVGYKNLPNLEDNMLPLVSKFCPLCGRFRAGHYIPKNLRPKLMESKMSMSWNKMYEDWKQRMSVK
jgi:hypothetical protein